MPKKLLTPFDTAGMLRYNQSSPNVSAVPMLKNVRQLPVWTHDVKNSAAYMARATLEEKQYQIKEILPSATRECVTANRVVEQYRDTDVVPATQTFTDSRGV